MADHKDGDAIPSTESPTMLPLKKRTIAGKTLPVPHNKEDLTEEFKKTKIKQLQRKAYYSVLNAFISETSTISNKRKQIIQELMKVWEIPQEALIPVMNKIEKDLLIPEHIEKPLTNYQSFNFDPYVPKSGSSWGSTNPEFFVGLCVSMRMSDEEEFEDYIIKEYDSKQEMHRLENTDHTKMEMYDDFLSWIDLREVPPADIKWQIGELKTNFDNVAPHKSSIRRSLF